VGLMHRVARVCQRQRGFVNFAIYKLIYVVDDHSRVVLQDYGPDFDYINASYISVIFVL